MHDQPDAGLWEFRGRASVHTYSSVMCWAACDRLAKIAARFGLAERVAALARPRRPHPRDDHRARLERRRAGTSSTPSAAIAWMRACCCWPTSASSTPTIRVTSRPSKRSARACAAGTALYRYIAPDDFGAPETSFTICTFWYVEALAAIGRHDEARSLFESVLARRNPLGLLSEDLGFEDGEAWGNFPQTYSHVGLISAAMRLSRPWQDAT